MEIKWKRKQDAEVLQSREIEGVSLLQFPLLENTGLVTHSFSTRLGGVSEGKFSTMNFTFTRGDNPDHVMENYRRMAKALGVSAKRMVLSYQTHTVHVRQITEEDTGKGIVRDRDYADVDGMITNVPGITLVTFYADCVPLYFLDPVHKAIGLSHSGWRGTVNRMGKVTLEAMERAYGSRPEDMLVCIGPSICKDCYEVGEEVVEAFRQAFSPEDWDQLLMKKPDGKYQLDLWHANERILLESGVLSEHIQTTDICTHCNPDFLFSHRTMGNERGNLAAFLCLKASGE